MSELIDRSVVQAAMRTKSNQLIEYHKTLSDRDDDAGKHARAVAEGRLLQLEQDLALLDLLKTS